MDQSQLRNSLVEPSEGGKEGESDELKHGPRAMTVSLGSQMPHISASRQLPAPAAAAIWPGSTGMDGLK
jgi:hypothetical protein